MLRYVIYTCSYIFVICLMKCLSWIKGSTQGLVKVFSLASLFPCYLSLMKVSFNSGQ